MKVKMLVSMAGASGSRKPGDVLDVPDDVGRAWSAAKIAAIIKEKQPVPAPDKGGKGRKRR